MTYSILPCFGSLIVSFGSKYLLFYPKNKKRSVIFENADNQLYNIGEAIIKKSLAQSDKVYWTHNVTRCDPVINHNLSIKPTFKNISLNTGLLISRVLFVVKIST